MQKVTTRPSKYSYKASQCYLLTKLEPFTKEELGITMNGSLETQTHHEKKHPHSEKLGQKSHGNMIAPAIFVAHLPWKSYIQCQYPVPRVQKLDQRTSYSIKGLSIF